MRDDVLALSVDGSLDGLCLVLLEIADCCICCLDQSTLLLYKSSKPDVTLALSDIFFPLDLFSLKVADYRLLFTCLVYSL